MRAVAGFLAVLAGCGVAEAATPVAWVLRNGGGDCTLALVYADGRTTTSESLETGCDLATIAFGADEVALVFRTANGAPDTLWRVTPRATRRLEPPAASLLDAGYDGGALIAIGLDPQEAYSAVRAKIAYLVPGDPGCRPAQRKAMALEGASWVTRERAEGTCAGAPETFDLEWRWGEEARRARGEVETLSIVPGPRASVISAPLRERFHGEWLVQGEPPRVATQSSPGQSLVVMLDAPEAGLVLRVHGESPIVYERGGVRIVSTAPQTGILVVRDGRPLFTGDDGAHAGFWGLRETFEVEGW